MHCKCTQYTYTCMWLFLLANCWYHTALKSALQNAHLSVILDLVADKLKRAVLNLYYRSSLTGDFMVLLCCEIAILSLLLVLLQVFVSGHILQVLHLAHSWFLVYKALGELVSFCRSHCHLWLVDNFWVLCRFLLSLLVTIFSLLDLASLHFDPDPGHAKARYHYLFLSWPFQLPNQAVF